MTVGDRHRRPDLHPAPSAVIIIDHHGFEHESLTVSLTMHDTVPLTVVLLQPTVATRESPKSRMPQPWRIAFLAYDHARQARPARAPHAPSRSRAAASGASKRSTPRASCPRASDSICCSTKAASSSSIGSSFIARPTSAWRKRSTTATASSRATGGSTGGWSTCSRRTSRCSAARSPSRSPKRSAR